MLKRVMRILNNTRWPLLNGLIYSAALSLSALFLYLDRDTIALSGTGGFVAGVVIALVLRQLVSGMRKHRQSWLQAGTTLLGTGVIVFFIGPYIAVQLMPYSEINTHSICCETPKDYGASEYTSVTLPVADGATLSGWYVAPAKGSDAVIILVHGHFNDRRGTKLWTQMFIAAGYGVFIYDQRGNGESTGIMDFTSPGLSRDLLTAMQYVAQQPAINARHIGVVGLSMGAHVAITAAELQPKIFNALWLDGISAQGVEDVPPHFWGQQAIMKFYVERFFTMAEQHLGRSIERESAISSILPKLKDKPIMLVAGALEDFEAEPHKIYAQQASANLQTWLIPDGHHLTGPYTMPDEYRQRMLAFFDAAFNLTKTN